MLHVQFVGDHIPLFYLFLFLMQLCSIEAKYNLIPFLQCRIKDVKNKYIYKTDVKVMGCWMCIIFQGDTAWQWHYCGLLTQRPTNFGRESSGWAVLVCVGPPLELFYLVFCELIFLLLATFNTSTTSCFGFAPSHS